MSTLHAVVVALAIALLVFICAAAISSSEPVRVTPATCPGCQPVPYMETKP